MSGGERPDLEALKELEDVLRHIETELASWRRRALAAEAKAGDLMRVIDASDDAPTRSQQLEAHGRELAQRVETAQSRVNDLIARLAFLEQQSNGGMEAER